MYSGSIISLKDIKFELIKTINRFCFINLSDNDCNAEFSLASQIISFYPLSFMSYKDNYDSTQISSIFLFLIFHEVCGHLKTNINNNSNSPYYHLNNELNLIFTNFTDNDSGFIFESILTGSIINCKAMIKSEKSKELFDIKYYIQDNFDELKKK
jgi:hypothetical protein